MWTAQSLESFHTASKTERRRRTQLDEVPNEAHDEETNTDGLADLEELLLVRCKKRTELVAPHDQTA